MMRHVIFSLLLFCSVSAFAQLPDLDAIKLEKASDYKPANPAALAAANYILSVPITKDESYTKPLQFVLQWMKGTPDYGFEVGNDVLRLVKGNESLLGVYMAAMTKYTLENPESAKDHDAVKKNAIDSLVAYCQNPDMKVKMNKALRKLADEKRVGNNI
jgi:hypothetical protein